MGVVVVVVVVVVLILIVVAAAAKAFRNHLALKCRHMDGFSSKLRVRTTKLCRSSSPEVSYAYDPPYKHDANLAVLLLQRPYLEFHTVGKCQLGRTGDFPGKGLV